MYPDLKEQMFDPSETLVLVPAGLGKGGLGWIFPFLFTLLACLNQDLFGQSEEYQTYRHFEVEEKGGRIVGTKILLDKNPPLWAKKISQKKMDWSRLTKNPERPYFEGPIPFMLPPVQGSGEPFYKHNHQPSITWLDNGDLMAIWFSTEKESGTEMTVLASRLRKGKKKWEPSSEFFKSKERNMTGSSLYNDGAGSIYHFNSIGAEGATGWANLAILLRISKDNGEKWTGPEPIMPEIRGRHQVIDGTVRTSNGTLLQPCDAHHSSSGGTALMISNDDGITWMDPGEGKEKPDFKDGGKGFGTIAGIHAGVVELKDGSLLALGRSDNINGQMPMSRSTDMGQTWTYSESPFPPISSGQRLVLMRLKEGPILFVSFTHHPREKEGGMAFWDNTGNEFSGTGMYAALSYDEGKSWPVKKLLTPGKGEYEGGGWTGMFETTSTTAEPMGYLAAIQSPDNTIHLISSRMHYRFNLKWLETPNTLEN